MTALCFSEHGNIYNWWEKRTKILNAGMKWIHGIEAYITFNNIDDKDAEKTYNLRLWFNFGSLSNTEKDALLEKQAFFKIKIEAQQVTS